MKKILILAALVVASASAQAVVIDFDDNVLAANTFYDPQANTVWSSGGADFEHSWNTTYNCCWGGFIYSNQTDTTTAGFLNDRSAITVHGDRIEVQVEIEKWLLKSLGPTA